MSRGSAGGPDGLLVIDKPAGMTSHDVVARVRRILGTRKVGHAGTLDPMATGVLVVGVGRGTRLLGHLVLTDKAYDATIRLGASTTTDDAEGEVVASADASAVPEELIVAGALALTGSIEQVPSSVSAVKVDGKRAYARVRAGETVDLPARRVTVAAFDVLDVRRVGAFVDVDARVECSSGTYVRALARDLGAALGVGGHLTALRRTRVGPYRLDRARTLEDLEADPSLEPLAAAASVAFPTRDLEAGEVVDLGHGRPVGVSGTDGPVAAVGPDGTLVALLRDDAVAGRARPLVVLAPADPPGR